jgi:TadE-like protein
MLRRTKANRGEEYPTERGATLVEMAILLPLLLILLLGIIDFGMLFNQWLSVRNGTREGLRQAIVDPAPPAPGGATWSCPIVSPTPPAVGTDAHSLVCFTKSRIALNEDSVRVKVHFEPPFRGGQPVKICVQYLANSPTGIAPALLSRKILSAQITSLIEMDKLSFTTPFEETPFTAWPTACEIL